MQGWGCRSGALTFLTRRGQHRASWQLEEKFQEGCGVDAGGEGMRPGLRGHRGLGRLVWVRVWSVAFVMSDSNPKPPGSSVHGILQARILEWVARPSSWEIFLITLGLNQCQLHLLYCRWIPHPGLTQAFVSPSISCLCYLFITNTFSFLWNKMGDKLKVIIPVLALHYQLPPSEFTWKTISHTYHNSIRAHLCPWAFTHRHRCSGPSGWTRGLENTLALLWWHPEWFLLCSTSGSRIREFFLEDRFIYKSEIIALPSGFVKYYCQWPLKYTQEQTGWVNKKAVFYSCFLIISLHSASWAED